MKTKYLLGIESSYKTAEVPQRLEFGKCNAGAYLDMRIPGQTFVFTCDEDVDVVINNLQALKRAAFGAK